jgi:hypothetical protein
MAHAGVCGLIYSLFGINFTKLRLPAFIWIDALAQKIIFMSLTLQRLGKIKWQAAIAKIRCRIGRGNNPCTEMQKFAARTAGISSGRLA